MRSDSSIDPTLCLLFEPSRLRDATSRRTRGEDGERRGVILDVPGGKTFVPGPEHDRGLMLMIGSGLVEASVSISREGQEGVGALLLTSVWGGCGRVAPIASGRDGDTHTAGMESLDAGSGWGTSKIRDGSGEDFIE